MTTDVMNMIKDIDKELTRTKKFMNDNGYNNMTAFNLINRRYRKELKELRFTITEDRDSRILDYKDIF